MVIENNDIESIEIKDGKLIINAKNKFDVRSKIFIEIKGVETKITKEFQG